MEDKSKSQTPKEIKKVEFLQKEDMNEVTQLKIQDKNSDSNLVPNFNISGSNESNKCLIFWYLFCIILYTIWIYIIKPLSFILEIIFLTTIVNIKAAEFQKETSNLLSSSLQAIGWIIILVLPLFNYFTVGIRITSLQGNIFGKIYVTILNIFEILFNFPLTFLYETNIYSIFLYEEKGIKQLLSPWLIFFTTEYVTSIFEIFRNFIDPAFFLALGFMKLGEIASNQYQVYLIIILNIMLVMNILRFFGNFFIFIIRVKNAVINCKKKPNKIDKKN